MQAFPFDSQLTFDSDNNPIYDRAVSSQPLRKLIRDLFTTGVMPNPSTNLQVSAGTDGMTVQVAAGFAVIDGGLCQETETRTLEVTAADDTYDRIDTVVLRWNENVDVRTADLYIIAGTPSANPVRPTLQRDNSIYEIGLADVFVTKRVATVTNDKITDTRYETGRCGIVSSVSEWDTTTIYQQVQADLAGFKAEEQAEFLAWFESIRDILDENVAAHLQGEIDTINDTLDNLNASTVSFDDTTAQIGSNNVQGAIEGLKVAFSSALTSLKATPIAQVVGATGNTFAAVIQKLNAIVVRQNNPNTRWQNSSGRPVTNISNGGARGACSDGTIRTVVEVPTGYYQNGKDLVGITDLQLKQLGGFLIPSGNKAITANGSNIDVKANATVSVAVPQNVGYYLNSYNRTGAATFNLPSGYKDFLIIAGSSNVSQGGGKITWSSPLQGSVIYNENTNLLGGTFCGVLHSNGQASTVTIGTAEGYVRFVAIIGVNVV